MTNKTTIVRSNSEEKMFEIFVVSGFVHCHWWVLTCSVKLVSLSDCRAFLYVHVKGRRTDNLCCQNELFVWISFLWELVSLYVNFKLKRWFKVKLATLSSIFIINRMIPIWITCRQKRNSLQKERLLKVLEQSVFHTHWLTDVCCT